jgi:hypothetical protein
MKPSGFNVMLALPRVASVPGKMTIGLRKRSSAMGNSLRSPSAAKVTSMNHVIFRAGKWPTSDVNVPDHDVLTFRASKDWVKSTGLYTQVGSLENFCVTGLSISDFLR